MRLDNLMADRQAKAQAHIARGEKGHEGFLGRFRGEAGAVVLHFDLQSGHAVAAGFGLQTNVNGRRGGVGLQGVEHQVEQRLLQFDVPRFDRRQIQLEFQGERHVNGDQFAAQHDGRFARHLADVEQLFLGRVLSRERAHAVDDLAGPLIVADDVLNGGPRFRQVGEIAGQQTAGGLRIGEDGAEWLVQFVGERAGDFS